MNLLTIFTPTYNRAHLLPNLFNSLLRQECKKFEWIVVDDCSSDDTEYVVNKFIESTPGFNIIYLKQEHGGKHRAINLSLSRAKGDMFFIVDSDDLITDNAVKLIFKWSSSIENKIGFCGVSGLRISKTGQVWGGRTKISGKHGYIDATNLEREAYKLNGDKAEIFITDIIKKFPFPEFQGEYFVTEAVCWNAMAAAGYKIRWFNEPIYICEYLDDGLTKNGANTIKGHIDNYQGYLYYIRQSYKIKPICQFILDFSDYEKTAKYLNRTFVERAMDLNISISEYYKIKFLMRPYLLLFRKIKERFI